MRISQLRFLSRLARFDPLCVLAFLIVAFPVQSLSLNLFVPSGVYTGADEVLDLGVKEQVTEGPLVQELEENESPLHWSLFTGFEASQTSGVNEGRGDGFLGWFLSSWAAGTCENGELTNQAIIDCAKDAAASSTYKHGKRYYAVDGCWLKSAKQWAAQPTATHTKEEKQVIQTNDILFPGGVARTAALVHLRGLLFGLGLTVSAENCPEHEPNTYGIEASDIVRAATSWGVDFLKLNSCASSTPQALLEFREWRKVVNSQKAPLSLLCSWTRQSSDSGDDEDFEDFHLLCDEFIDNGRAVKGGSRLAAELDSWLLAQPHGEDVSWRGSPKLQRQWSDPSSEAELKTNLAMAAVLGSRAFVQASSVADFKMQTRLLEDKVLLAAFADPMRGTVRRISAADGVSMLSRQLADGDHVIALLNWRSEPFSIKASHTEIMNWCNLQKPVPFKISQAWETQQRRLAKDDKQTLTYTLQQLGAVLLQVELTDDLAENEEASLMYNPHIFQEGSNKSSSTGGLLTVDVLHKRGSAPLFTAGSRLLHRENPGEIKSVEAREGGFGRITGNEEKNNGLFDSAFKTVFGLLLPVVLASALGGSAAAAADSDVGEQQWSHHEGHHHKHHKKRHHYHHTYGKHSHEQPHQQSGEPNVPHTQARTQPHESSVPKEGSSTGLRQRKADELANSSSSSSGSSNSTNNTRSAGGAWLLLCGMAVLVCMGIVAAWRALLIRKLRKKTLGKERDAESLVERPHAQ